ncbi:MAG: TauD/TfdA family dioxygenase [Ectothiorhodospiraceae bacterium]|nr:TauD/TfdA family dioxygenase [Chromatiales bacterium]MCP5154535.1 TauD/TfdA family dioxygenase [Ectothiorhodospiraceae bacterium]
MSSPEPLSRPFGGPGAWRPSDLETDGSWLFELDGEDLAELDAAVRSVRARGLEAEQFDREAFLAPRLEARAGQMVEVLERGRGLVLVRGIDPARYDEPTLRALYWGIGTHIGVAVSQNAAGEHLAEVTDRGRDYQAVNVRGYTTSAALRFHCDASDVVGLLCVHHAARGGESLVASAMTIHDLLLAEHPEHLPPLYRGFHFDLRGEGGRGDPNEVTDHRVPVFSHHRGILSCRYNQRTIEDGQRKSGAPLDEAELAAVRAVGVLAERPDVQFSMRFRPGDIQLLNNHVVLHARTAFEDFPEPERRRRLLRLWLNLRHGRPLDARFANRLNTGPRGGVAVRPRAA